MAVRVLFVSSTTVGGSGRSQRELAARLVGLGHTVLFLVRRTSRRRVAEWWFEQCDDAAVKLARTPARRLFRWLASLNGRWSTREMLDGLDHRFSPVPENVVPRLLASFQPDIVVGNSIHPLSWRRIRELCGVASVPTVLYVREDDTLRYFDGDDPPGDAFVANAQSLCRAVEQRGFECTFIPSVIEVGVTRVESTRRVALVINPVESRGASIVERIAISALDIPIVVQESWPLGVQELAWVESHLACLPNVEFRRAEPPGPALYADARLLLVPYRVDNRPRVIAEAQANGIPVVVGEVPALVEAVGPGGVAVPLEDESAWVEAIRSLWADAETYRRMSEEAVRHSQRAEIDPIEVAERFADALADWVTGHGRHHSSGLAGR